MFFFPFRLWEGGIFHEHLHRLVASGLGLWTLVLAVWISFGTSARRLRILAWLAVFTVVVQGVLGGKRVLLNSVDVLSVPGSIFFGGLHATTAQVFLVLLSTIALMTSRFWQKLVPQVGATPSGKSAALTLLAIGTLAQLVVAATMRHQHAGLAIPDFPLAYGQVVPRTDPQALAEINQRRVGVVDDSPVSAFQIWLQMLHRVVAVLLVVSAFLLACRTSQESPSWSRCLRLLAFLFGIQFCLGAATIWTNKAADVATAHVAVGATILSVASVLAVARFSAERQRTRAFKPCPEPNALLKTSAAPAGGHLS
jgi:cytochrome c oxidase assembly protein subunit 15